MIAVAGSILNVNDSKNAIAPTGPKPGSTPTSVPTRDPRKQKSKFVGVSATEKPSATLVKRSTSDSQDAGGERNTEKPAKNGVGDQRRRHSDADDFGPPLSLYRTQQQDHQKKGR